MAAKPCVYPILRSGVLWIAGSIYFFTAGSILALLSFFLSPKKADRLFRIFCRHVLFLTGATVKAHRSPRLDPRRTYFFVSNHVNLFDPCVLLPVIPQLARGLELETHFKIPVYGWLSKRLGNIPVPVVRGPASLKRMWKRTKEALDQGISVVVLPEGTRTKTGYVGPFKDGAFRMAIELGYPLVPISMNGAFEFNRKTSWMIRPSTIMVQIHDPIETKNLRSEDVPGLRERVREIICAHADPAN